MSTRAFSSAILAVSLFSVVLNGCKKAAPPAPPPPPPAKATEVKPAERPTVAVFVAEPSTIVRGNPATLRWAVSGATDISIDQGIGSVPASGTRVVYPSNDATYTLVARGVGGVTESRVRVTVTSPTAPVEPPKQPTTVTSTRRTWTEILTQDVKDAYFDFDSFEVRDDARNVLTANGEYIKRALNEAGNAANTFTIEGHCDERGSDAYNVALGDRRAQAAFEFLKGLGVPGERVKTTSYGKERPQCTDATEDCWQRNRRVHFQP